MKDFKINISERLQKVIDGNVIIANYLEQHAYGDYYDVENHEYPDAGSFWENATETIYHKANLLYHYQWDWLEDAINKIKEENPSFSYNADDIDESFNQVVDYIKSLS